MGGDITLSSREVSPTCGVTANTNSLTGIEDDSFTAPGYSESTLNDSALDRLIIDLVPSLNKDSNHIPLSTFLGNLTVDDQLVLRNSK